MMHNFNIFIKQQKQRIRANIMCTSVALTARGELLHRTIEHACESEDSEPRNIF